MTDHLCPVCGCEMQYRPYQPAEPDTGTSEYPSGWDCDCGHAENDMTPAELIDHLAEEAGHNWSIHE